MSSDPNLPLRGRIPAFRDIAECDDGRLRPVVTLGLAATDAALNGGLLLASLHEVYAATQADAPAATGFALALACRVKGGQPLVWVRQDYSDLEAGFPNPWGLVEFGLDPSAVIRVCAQDARDALQAGLDATRLAAKGVALIELWGAARSLDLTASRRLALAAKSSGVTVLLVQSAATPQPSAAETRWRVSAALSRALPANAPGNPAFTVSLLRHRSGAAGQEWHVEWNRDAGRFEDGAFARASTQQTGNVPLLSGGMAPVSAGRAGAAGKKGDRLREAG